MPPYRWRRSGTGAKLQTPSDAALANEMPSEIQERERERMKEMERNKERTEEGIIRTDSEFIHLLTKTFKFIHKSTYSSSPPPVAPTEL